jgi:hypothetical protein
MESIKNFLKSLLSEDGNISSKRFIAIAGFFFLAFTMFINSFFDVNKIPADSLVSAVEFITIAAIGGVASEKFSKKESKQVNEDEMS